jgi:hypothetical protein
MIRRSAIFLLPLVAVALFASGADGHRLSNSKAKHSARAVAIKATNRLDTAQLDDVTTVEVRRRTVGPCKRRSDHRLDCRILLRGLIHDPDLGDLPFRCYTRERVRLKSRRSHGIRKRSTKRKCTGDLADLKQDLKLAFRQALR